MHRSNSGSRLIYASVTGSPVHLTDPQGPSVVPYRLTGPHRPGSWAVEGLTGPDGSGVSAADQNQAQV